jgi:hypothetical protein
MQAADGALFCPRRGINAGATQRLESESRTLLQTRLSAVALLCAVSTLLSVLRFVFVNPTGMWAPLALGVTCVACWMFLRQPRLPHTTLVVVGLVLFAAMLATIGTNTYLLLGEALATGDYGVYHANANRLPGLYLLIMLAYAMLIPSRWRSTLWLVISVIVASLAAPLALMWTQRPAFEAAGASIDRVEQISFALLMLFIGGFFAVYGSHIINNFRRSAAEASDAGMYRLLGKLGEGGMGEVWRAEHRMLARPAAIKIIRPDLLGSGGASATATKRFTREARATAALQSPHTVQLYDFGVTRDGTFFYVMEMLHGMDMEDMVKRYGPMRPSRVVHLLRQAAVSLQEAHDHGLVHRDIKPGNLHVGVFAGEADWVKVLDFGLVKSSAEDQAGQTALTMEGVTTGTPAYFPPEMAAGAAAADFRSDVYALSAVAYWLVTGDLVFTAATPLEMVLQHVREEPVPPSQRTENPIPPGLEETILAGLSKDPTLRPQTMREFARRLGDAGAGDWGPLEAADWWQLHEPETLGGAA